MSEPENKRFVNSRNKWMIVWICLIGSSLACDTISQEELQMQYLKEKRSNFRAYKQRQCMKKILEEASSKADSFFIEMAREQTFDSTYIPKPIRRPVKPQLEMKEDSLPLQPIFKDSTDQLTDTLE